MNCWLSNIYLINEKSILHAHSACYMLMHSAYWKHTNHDTLTIIDIVYISLSASYYTLVAVTSNVNVNYRTLQ